MAASHSLHELNVEVVMTLTGGGRSVCKRSRLATWISIPTYFSSPAILELNDRSIGLEVSSQRRQGRTLFTCVLQTYHYC